MQKVIYLVFYFAFRALTLINADECDTFPNITNALFDNIDNCGIVKIRCMKGFRMVTNATCIGYLWVYKKPFCIPDKCLAEPNITNGDLDSEITSRHIDIEYNYTCRPRFRKNGDRGTLRCDPSGEWVIDVPCDAQCPAEVTIPNGDLDTNITARCEGSEYNYTCRPRFLKNGDGGTLRCNASGQWEFDVLCEAQCPAEATIPNADLDTNITARCEGSEYNYTCRPRFLKNGDGGTLRCNARGQWEIDVLCEAQCPAEATIPNGDLDTNITARCEGSEYNYTCRPRFLKNGDGGTLRCNASGQWEIDVLCEAQCPAEATIPNGDLDINITARCEGSEYNYTCRPRFLKNGDGGTLRCNASGQWEIDVLCEAQCPAEATIPNGDLDTNITARCEGSEYNYTCRPRFLKNGDGGTLRCNASGQWEIDVLCEAQCPAEATIPNAKLDTNITSRCEGSEYNYTCGPRFLKNGDGGTLRCNASGQWEFDVLCEAQCPAEANIPNGDLDTNITARCEGSEYNYTCRPVFVKNGTGGSLRCNASGEWVTDVPCVDCFKRNKNLEVQCAFLDVPTEADCQQECANNMDCKAHLFIRGRQPNCYLCAAPVVGLSLNASFSDCLRECGELQSCTTVLGVDFGFWLCTLFNDTCEALPSYENIIETPVYITAPRQIIAEKNTCPSLFASN